jgi:hypothetical protein
VIGDDVHFRWADAELSIGVASRQILALLVHLTGFTGNCLLEALSFDFDLGLFAAKRLADSVDIGESSRARAYGVFTHCASRTLDLVLANFSDRNAVHADSVDVNLLLRAGLFAIRGTAKLRTGDRPLA